MPNYTTSKGVLPPCDEPAYLSVGTDVSAKYKGAFCEAKIIDTNRHVKLKVLFKGSTSAYLVNDDDLKEGYEIKIGNTIEAKNPDKANSFMHATVTKVIDHSRYTVLFDDGDQSVLKRNSLRLKSGRHFAESETLDQLPLTNPEHFGNPVKVGLSETASSTNGKPLVNTSANDSTSLDESQPSTSLPKQASDAGSSESSTSSSNKDSSSKKTVQQGPTTANPIKGKRGGTRGRKRRDSTKDAPKSAQVPTESTEKESDDTSSENDETINKSIKFDSIDIGIKLKVKYGRGRLQKVYEAKVNKIELSDVGKYRYFVHYTGWNNRYDEWIPRSRIIDIVKDEPPKKKEKIKERKEKIKEKDKDKDKIDEKLDKEKNVDKEVIEKEVKKEKVDEREKDTERKKDKQKDVELKRDKEKELEKQKEEEIERKKEKERDIEKKIKEKEREKEKEKEKEKEREREKEKERLRELEEQRKAKELEELEKLEQEKAREVEEAREREREKEQELEKKLKLEEEEEERKRLAKQEELEKKEKELAKEKEQQQQRVKDEHDKATREREKERDKKDKERQKERERQKESERVQPMEVDKEMVNVQASYSSLSDALDEKIYLLQERISILRRQYISLRSELAHIDRKRRRMAVT